MNPGIYRQTIQIMKRTGYTTDEIGNQIPATEPFLKIHAYVNNLSGKEYWEAAQTQSENTVVFTVRHCRTLQDVNTREYFILWQGREYNITSLDNVQYKNETLKIRATAKE